MFTRMPEQWIDPATHVYFTQKEVDAMVKAVNDMGLEQGSTLWNYMHGRSWSELHELFYGTKN